VRKRIDLGQLEEIARLRAVQADVAAAKAARAVVSARAADAARQGEAEHLVSAEQGWQGSLASTGLATGVAALWAAELLGRQGAVRAAEAVLAEAQARVRLEREAWAASARRLDASRSTARDARGELLRRREEAALAEAADRAARERAE
jgi:hypothetical protein